jgi:hypothetical protein
MVASGFTLRQPLGCGPIVRRQDDEVRHRLLQGEHLPGGLDQLSADTHAGDLPPRSSSSAPSVRSPTRSNGPAVQDRPHPLPDLGRGGGLAEPEVPWQLDVGGQAGDGPAAPRDGHVRAGHGHAGPGHGAVADGVAQGHVDEGPEGADVADGREAGQHGGAGVGDPAERLLGGAAVDRRDAGPLELADQVGVAVDQARQQRVAGQVDQGRRLGDGPARVEHGLDPLAPDQHHPAGPHLPGLDVDHPVGPHRDQLAIPRHPASSCLPSSAHDDPPRFPIGPVNP